MLDKQRIEFRLNVAPPTSTSQTAKRIFLSKKTNRHFIGTSSKGKKIFESFQWLLKPHAPARPLRGALYLSVDWVFPWRKSESKKVREMGKIPRDTKPDLDNLNKFLADAMEKTGFFELGDQQISSLKVTKSWGEDAGIKIALMEL